jgi:glycolate oxidase iron-sulfur subunit
VLGLEADSPRGRIRQVLEVDAGRMPIGDSLALHMDRCLGCRACESACPSGVEYGRILERVRGEIEANYRRPLPARLARRYAYGTVLRSFRSLRRWARVLRFYQRSGLQRVLRATGLLHLLGLADLEALLPPIDSHFFLDQIGSYFPPRTQARGEVIFFAGCVQSVAFSELNRATIRVLNANGVGVFVALHQRCCGALHSHAGYRKQARHLARVNLRAIEELQCERILTNTAGCGAMLKSYGELLADDPRYAHKAGEFASKVRDVTEYLAEIGVTPPPPLAGLRVTYQDACHLAHGQKVRAQPRELLKALGVELVEMARADQCCGGAGTYNITQSRLSREVLDLKMADVTATKAEVLATTNVGCMMQLRTGIERSGLEMEVVHVLELLDRAYESARQPDATAGKRRRRRR